MEPRLLLPFAHCPLIISAQPVLDFANTGTLPGEFNLPRLPLARPGQCWHRQTWDFSSFTTDSLIQIHFVDPATTAEADSFPNATIAGFSIARTVTVSSTADAYGTLVLPWGNITDVMRTTYVEDYQDVGFITSTAHREYTYYLKAGTHYPLVQIYSFSTTVLGNTTTITGAQWMDAGSTQVQAAAPAQRMELYPIPANEEMNVRCEGSGPVSLYLLDPQGRLVLRQVINGTGPRMVRLDTRALPAGPYVLRTMMNGSLTDRKVVLAREGIQIWAETIRSVEWTKGCALYSAYRRASSLFYNPSTERS